MLFYNGSDSRPVFGTVEEMLKWTGLYGLTRRTLEEELTDAGLNSRTISELVTVWFFPMSCLLLSPLADIKPL
jgi:prenylcysteine oxidase / farnesylcysteine lyase